MEISGKYSSDVAFTPTVKAVQTRPLSVLQNWRSLRMTRSSLNLAERPGDATIAAARRSRRHHHHRPDRPSSIVARPQYHEKEIGDGAAGDLTIESCGQLPLHRTGRSSRWPIEQVEQHRGNGSDV